MKGLLKIKPKHKDYSFLHTFGATIFDTKGLPDIFSIYDGRAIPNQNLTDIRFTPNLPPLEEGCTGETGSFETGLQDGKLYNPEDLYRNTPPNDDGGRDIRAMLQTLIDRGVQASDGTMSPKRTAYFNCYGSGAIDDFDAVRIALWINQEEKRGVYVGSYFYREFVAALNPTTSGIVPVPSFNTSQGSLHCWLVTGWKIIDGVEYLEAITWQGQYIEYFSREIYNALMAQPWTGAFTITKTVGQGVVTVGIQAYIDHLIYFIRNLFNV